MRQPLRAVNKIIAALFAVAIAALVFLTWRESTAARNAESALAAAVQQRDDLRDRVAELESRAEALAAENAQHRTAAEAPRSATAPAPVVAAAPARTITRGIPPGGPGGIFDSPEMRRLIALEQKGRLDSRYAGLFRALNLPPDKLDRLKHLLVDRQNAPADVLGAAHQQDLLNSGAGRQELRQLVEQEQRSLDAAIRELLGEAAFEEYQQYEQTHAERSVVDRLADRLSYGAAPLSAQQAEALVDLLAADRTHRSTTAPSPEAAPGVRLAIAVGGPDTTFSFGPGFAEGGNAPITDAALAGAAGVLNEAQLAALREIQAEQQARQQMLENVRHVTVPPPPPEGTATWGPATSAAPAP